MATCVQSAQVFKYCCVFAVKFLRFSGSVVAPQGSVHSFLAPVAAAKRKWRD